MLAPGVGDERGGPVCHHDQRLELREDFGAFEHVAAADRVEGISDISLDDNRVAAGVEVHVGAHNVGQRLDAAAHAVAQLGFADRVGDAVLDVGVGEHERGGDGGENAADAEGARVVGARSLAQGDAARRRQALAQVVVGRVHVALRNVVDEGREAAQDLAAVQLVPVAGARALKEQLQVLVHPQVGPAALGGGLLDDKVVQVLGAQLGYGSSVAGAGAVPRCA